MSSHLFTQEKHSIHRFILDQIANAFQATPNIAATLHGQRKIYQGCSGRRTSLFPSTKCGGAIPLESRLELVHAICLERDPTVQSYRTQAIKIPLSPNNFCIPDFLVQTIDIKYEIHEIKPSIASLSPQELDRFEKIANLLDPLGIEFKLIDQHSLPSLKQQQQLLYWYQRGHQHSWSQIEIELATKTLQQRNFDGISQIYTLLRNEGLDLELGDYLLFHEVISLTPQNYFRGVA